MKLSDIYFNQNQCIYEMDSQRKALLLCPQIIILLFVMTSSTKLEEYMHYK